VKRRWSKPLLGKLGLDEALLPTVYESEDVTGRLTSEAAELLGLSTDCVVVGGAGDCAAGAIGNGIVKKGLVNTSLGTSGVVFAYSDEPEVDPDGRLHTFCHAVRGKWHQMGVTLAAAGSLGWFAQALCPGEGEDVFEKLVAEAAERPIGADGLYFLPYLAGERTPHADPNARGAFVGLTLSHDRGALVRAVLEGVTYSLRDCLDLMRGLGVPVKEIRATGGGAKSPLWRHMQADQFGVKVRTMGADEGPAYGVALLAAVGCGEFKNISEACAATVRTAEETKPNAKARREYDQRAAVYRELYGRLKPAYDAIAELSN